MKKSQNDDLKPYKPFGLSMLQLMALIALVSFTITVAYSWIFL